MAGHKIVIQTDLPTNVTLEQIIIHAETLLESASGLFGHGSKRSMLTTHEPTETQAEAMFQAETAVYPHRGSDNSI